MNADADAGVDVDVDARVRCGACLGWCAHMASASHRSCGSPRVWPLASHPTLVLAAPTYLQHLFPC